MKINEFLLEHFGAVCERILFEEHLSSHWDGYVSELWTPTRFLIVSEVNAPRTVELAKTNLLLALKPDGYDFIDCVLQTQARDYREKLEESIADGRIEGVSAIIAIGGNEIYEAGRSLANKCDMPFCGFLTEFPTSNILYNTKLFDSTEIIDTIPRALFVDLSLLASTPAHQKLEIALRTLCLAQAGLTESVLDASFGQPNPLVSECFANCLQAFTLDNLQQFYKKSDKNIDIAQNSAQSINTTHDLCEAITWLSLARKCASHPCAFEIAQAYQAQSEALQPFHTVHHFAAFTRLLQDWSSIEELELEPDRFAQKHPPKEVKKRSILMHLLEDGLHANLLEHFQATNIERQTIRTMLQTILTSWDNMLEKLQPTVQNCVNLLNNLQHLADTPNDYALKELWAHASDAFGTPAHIIYIVTSALRDRS